MLVLTFIVLGLALGLLRGGSLRTLADLDLRWVWLIPVGFCLQLAAFSGLIPASVAAGNGTAIAHLLSYATMLLAIVLNLGLWPLRVFGLGTLANAVVIAANDGYMPASPNALRAAGLDRQLAYLTENRALAGSTLMDASTRLPLLGDIFPLPVGDMANVFSVGDVFISLGVMLLVVQAMGRKHVDTTADYQAALAFIKQWPVTPSTRRPSDYTSRHTPAI